MPESPFSLSSSPASATTTAPAASSARASSGAASQGGAHSGARTEAQERREAERRNAKGTMREPEEERRAEERREESGEEDASLGIDLRWVWLEVRKRVFIKLPFSRPVAEAMEAVVPIAMEENTFVCGLSTQNFPLSGHLAGDNVRNTIKAILRQAAGHEIQFEVIEGTTIADWREIKSRRQRAQEAVIAMAEHKVGLHQYEDVLNQVVAEIRGRVTGTRDRLFPQVRAALVLDVVPLLSDAADMLFSDRDAHDARRVMARTIDRVAAFLEIQPLALALEIERYHRAQTPRAKRPESATATTENPPAAPRK